MLAFEIPGFFCLKPLKVSTFRFRSHSDFRSSISANPGLDLMHLFGLCCAHKWSLVLKKSSRASCIKLLLNLQLNCILICNTPFLVFSYYGFFDALRGGINWMSELVYMWFSCYNESRSSFDRLSPLSSPKTCLYLPWTEFEKLFLASWESLPLKNFVV